ncbi:hypothetical protein COV06_04105 [Candidatus Uhrbacteria bacterium CG10_big_fil_rev_8_21_14_0_10_50_16]|uniref:Uncharacterized protein n=1 Tax=Candidatus Uhrbacteria bacterium CG10_big_fil_rev_8_21_14_0_10_50_16 TaxID=1975039 RepID=A0A2H0RNB6_9BACT|nr:MAG: hypothetical protein COV06_04105 [Candidatus Uhrbacteria bacterium CG10_big_fil_rev_8_21_14_0_10_50_16]
MRVNGYSVQPSTWRAPRPVLEASYIHLTTLPDLTETLGSPSFASDSPQTPIRRLSTQDQPNNFIYSLPPCLTAFIQEWEQEPLTLPIQSDRQFTANRSLVRIWTDDTFTQTLQLHAPALINQIVNYCGYRSESQTSINAQMAIHLFGDQLSLRQSHLTSVLSILSPLPSDSIRSIFSFIRSDSVQRTGAFDHNNHSNLEQRLWSQQLYNEVCAWSHLVLHQHMLDRTEPHQMSNQPFMLFLEALYDLRKTHFQLHTSLTSSTSFKGHAAHQSDKLLGIPSHIDQLKDHLLHVYTQYNRLRPFLPDSSIAQHALSEIDQALISDVVRQLTLQSDCAKQDLCEDPQRSAKHWHKLATKIERTGSLLPQ